MPYDMITPYGPSAIGALTDEERMSRQNAHQTALALMAQSAQEAQAKAAGGNAPPKAGAGGYGGSGPSGFADQAPSAETEHMQRRNDMVDLRQQSTRAAQDRDTIERGIPEDGSSMDRGDWRGLQTAKITGELQNETQLNAIRDRYNALMGGGAGGASGAPAKSPEQNALVGGATPPAANNDAEENRLTELALLGTRLNGGNGQMPDIAGMFNKRADRKNNADRNAIELEALKGQLAETQRQAVIGKVQENKAAGGDVMDPKAAYATIAPAIHDDLNRVKEFIRSNNVSIAGNIPELHRLVDSVKQRIATLDASPQAKQLAEQDLQNIMRDALKENGLIFKSYGTEAVEKEFGL